MIQNPFRIERRLTPELFDHHVAQARAERGKAIAAFIGQAAGWLSRVRLKGAGPARSISVGRKVTN